MNLFELLEPEQAPRDVICSRKACRAVATTRLLWNNPKIHPPERRKTWLACDAHVAWLEDYLQSRSLWKETVPLTPEDPA